MRFNKEEKHPRTREWEKTGVAILSDSDAEVLNEKSAMSGIRYVPAEKEVVTIEVEGKTYDLAKVKEVHNSIDDVKKIKSNTGVEKTLKAIESLEEDIYESFLEELDK